MDYKFTYISDLGEEEFTEMDISGVSFEIQEDKEQLIYRKNLSGNIKFYGADFDYIYNKFNLGVALITGYFYADNISQFANSIKYKLNADSFDLESSVVEIEIYAIDDYEKLLSRGSEKVNIYSQYDTVKSSLTINKTRSKLYFYDTEVTGSSFFVEVVEFPLPNTANVYAREEIRNAKQNEINILNGLNGWELDGTALVRDWTYSFEEPNPNADLSENFIAFNEDAYRTTPVPLNQQVDTDTNLILYNDFLNKYTVVNSSAYVDDDPLYKYSYWLLINDNYYGTELEYTYITVENGIEIKQALKDLINYLDTTITSVNFDYQTIFDFGTGEEIILQHLSEIALCLTDYEIQALEFLGQQSQINPATIGNLTIDSLNKFLRDYWNIYFYRNENTIYYKHYSDLFEWATENDLTDSQFGDLTPVQIVSYNNQEKFKRIERTLTAGNIDFFGVDVMFDNVKNDNVKVVNLANFYTDINDAVGNSDKYNANSTDTWMLAHKGSDGVVVSEAQILSSRYDTFANEKMSTAWADENLLVGSDKTANVNGTNKTLTELFTYATLVDFEIPPAKVFEINERGFFKTQYSDFHRLQKLSLKLDGSPATITLYN
jgi:hypothetical protein